MNPQRLLLLTALALSSIARADIAPPDLAQCADEQAGAKCTTDSGRDGTCQQLKCSRLDYSNGVPPDSVEYDCLQCVVSAPRPPPSSSPASAEFLSATAPTPAPATKAMSCTAMPGMSLALTVLVAGWLSRRKSRGA
jgi:hypothetical protein